MKPVRTFLKFTAVCAGLYVLASASLRGAPQEGPPPALSRRPGYSAKAVGTPSSAASTNEIVVPQPPPNPTTSHGPILGEQKGRGSRPPSTPKAVRRGGEVVLASNRTTPTAVALSGSSSGVRQPPRALNGEAGGESGAPDPEGLRIRDELTRLHNDSEARRAFYEDLRRTVQQVRAGIRSVDAAERGEDSADQNDQSSRPGTTPSREVRTGSSDWPQSAEPREAPSKDPDGPQAWLNTGGGEIDHAAYQMVVRWAKANGTPVSLALGVAWMESHLNPHPARGAAGEVGMFQIMPERCTLEGWPARRLKEPEFNAWMGTLLLARYYQEEGSVARAAAKYVAGPGVFDRKYSKDVWTYINWYASTVDGYASYFSRYQS